MEELEQGLLEFRDYYHTQGLLAIGDKVTITWLGNTSADGSGKKMASIGVVGYITEINTSALYPYAVSTDLNGSTYGYFTRNSLWLMSEE